MKGRKNLKNKEAIKCDDTFLEKVTESEDLTNARVRLLRHLRELPQTDLAYARDGSVITMQDEVW